MKDISKKVNFKFSGNGSSLYAKSTGTYDINKIVLRYIDWLNPIAMQYKKDGDEKQLYASISLFGPNTGMQYTDKKIEKEINSNTKFKDVVYNLVLKALKSNKVFNPIPPNISFGWSEAGMQPENGWNFDVVFKY